MTAGDALTAAQRRVVEHGEGAMLVSGPAGSGRSEALARRMARLAAEGTPPNRVLVLTRSRAAAARLRDRVATLVERPYEELWIASYEGTAERLLREHALEAGLDPFFATVRPADRLAMLLARLDELSLRRHEIRGNPAGLLAQLLRRVDALKAEGVGPDRLRDWAERGEREARDAASRELARREREFADFYASHDRVLHESGSLDGGDLVIELQRLLRERADVRSVLAERFPFVVVDELEEAGRAHRTLVEALVAEHGNLVCSCDPGQAVRRPTIAAADPTPSFLERYPDAEHVTLDRPLRFGPAIAAAGGAIAAAAAKEAPARASDEVAGQASKPVAPAAPGPGASGAEDEQAPVRFWRCAGERAEAQAAALEIEHLLAASEARPEAICVIVGSGWREARLVAAALEERSVPFRFAGEAALFQRPEVRDVIAWLRMLADPTDSAAAVRALTRPPVDLRSIDLARCTAIARRRKLDMISALEAALESPQLPPEARDRIQAFLKLHKAASSAMEEIRADVFVRRLIERIGFRRHRLFVATPEAAERLQSLSRLSELAGAWARREPRGSVRDFVRHLTAVADAGELEADDALTRAPGAVVLAEPEQVKGLEFDRVYLLGLHRDAMAGRRADSALVPEGLVGDPGGDVEAGEGTRRARLAYLASTRARNALVLSWPEARNGSPAAPSRFYEAARAALGAGEERHAEELFGPAEGLHSTYRMMRDDVLEASWRAGSALSEMRLDTAEDVTRAVTRYLELIKLAALVQRPGGEPAGEALAGLNEVLGRAASPEQRAALEASALDEYLVSEERDAAARRELVAARREPSLEQFIPRRGDGLALSASDIDLYRTCPLKYKFARVFAIPQEPTINQRFGILIHQVLERFHAEALRADALAEASGRMQAAGRGGAGTLDRLLALFEAGWRRTGFGSSDDELQYRDRAVAALARYHERYSRSESKPVWLERSFSFAIGPHKLRGRVDRIDRLPDGSHELIDYKTGERRAEPGADVQLALYRLGAREAWHLDAELGSYWYVLEDTRVPVAAAADDRERVERTVLEVGSGIEGQDFEPRPSYEICSWCDYRLICPASEA